MSSRDRSDPQLIRATVNLPPHSPAPPQAVVASTLLPPFKPPVDGGEGDTKAIATSTQDRGDPSSQGRSAADLPLRNAWASRRLHARSKLDVGALDPAAADSGIVGTLPSSRPLASSRPTSQSTQSWYVQVAAASAGGLVLVLLVVLAIMYYRRVKRPGRKKEHTDEVEIDLRVGPMPQSSQSAIGDTGSPLPLDGVQIDLDISSKSKLGWTKNLLPSSLSLTAQSYLQVPSPDSPSPYNLSPENMPWANPSLQSWIPRYDR